MDKKIAGLLGAAAALTTMTAANAAAPAASPEVAAVTSYRGLLDPVPNPVDALKADDARLAQTPVAAGVQVAQDHHHHHHHVVPRPLRRLLPRRHHHHHHHHHH